MAQVGSIPSMGARQQRRTKQDVCDSFLEQLRDRGDIDIGAAGFIEGICQHFERLPTRYALDVNIDSLDVLSHKRLLDEARLDPTTVSFAVRSVEVLHPRVRESADGLPSPAFPEVSRWHNKGMPLRARCRCYQHNSSAAVAAVVSCSKQHACAGLVYRAPLDITTHLCSALPQCPAALASARHHAAHPQAAAAQASIWVIA